MAVPNGIAIFRGSVVGSILHSNLGYSMIKREIREGTIWHTPMN